MTDSLKDKYVKMAENRDDFNYIDPKKFLLPDMGEMTEEDLMNEILQQYNDADDKDNKDKAKDKEKTELDKAFYVENPFSLTPGYFEKQGAFVLKVENIHSENFYNNKIAWELNKYDGDTLDFSVNNLDDGNQSFSLFSDASKTKYKNFKDFYKKLNGSNNLQIRFLGMDAAEIPHFQIVPVKIEDEKNVIKEMTYKEMLALRSHGTTLLYEKCPYYDGKVHQRKDDDKVKVLYMGKNNGKESYVEIITRFKDPRQMYIDNRDANKGSSNITQIDSEMNKYNFYVILSKEESQSNLIADGYVAQKAVKDTVNKASEIILVINANGISAKNTGTSTSAKTFNSIYYLPDVAEYVLDQWETYYKDLPITNYSYIPVGMDNYQRCLGVVYCKVDGKWINLNKYVITQTTTTIQNPTFNDSPELQDIGAGVSDSFNLWSYYKDNIQWIDSFDKLTKNSYQEKIELHKKLTGIDFTQDRNCALMIGDTLLLTPPESIRNVSQSVYERLPAMRSKGTMAKDKANVEQMLEISLYFYEENGINGIPYTCESPNGTKLQYYMNGLRSLLAQFKVAPFLPIENGYINDVLGIEAVTLQNISIQSVEGFPRLLKAVLTLEEFNYRMFMPDMPISTNDNKDSIDQMEPMFAKCFNWELFRYYYQKAINAGENLANIERKGGFATYDYNLEFYSNKDSIGPFIFCGELGNKGEISFYIPQEDWLNNALQLKKERDSSTTLTTTAAVDLTDNAKAYFKGLATIAKSLKSIINYKNKDFNKVLDSFIGKAIRKELQLKAMVPSSITLDSIFGDGVYEYKQIGTKSNSRLQVYDNDNKSMNTDLIAANYIFPLQKAVLDSINDANYVKEVYIDENLSKGADKVWSLQWDFHITLNTDKITDEEFRDIKEVLSKKLDNAKPNDIFKDNSCVISFKMSFLEQHWGQGYVPMSLGDNIEHTFVHVKSNDETVLDGLIKGIDEDNPNDPNGEPSNTYNEEIDFFIKDYKNPANMPYVPYLENVLCKSMMANTANSFTEVNIKAIEGKGPQYMGGQDTQLQFECITDDITVVSALNTLPTLASAMAKKYRRILPAWPIKIRSDLTRLMGVSEVLIDAIEVSTVEGYPGVYSIVMRLTSVDRTQRQREALRRLDVAPVGGKVGYNYDSNMGMRNYFAIDNALGEVELYPDLNIPSLKELAKLGFRFVKYTGQNRSYPDPDFYIIYNYPYTSLLIKKMVKDILTKNLLNPEGKDEAHLFQFQDILGMKLTGKIEEYTGISLTKEEGTAKKYSEIIDDLGKRIDEKLQTESGLTNKDKDKIKNVLELSTAIQKITMSNITDGWEIKPGWKAPLADKSVNEAISNLDKDKNAYAQEILDKRRKAIELIDKLLAQPITYKNDGRRKMNIQDKDINYKSVCKNAVKNLFWDNEDGKELIKLLNGGYSTSWIDFVEDKITDEVFGSDEFSGSSFNNSYTTSVYNYLSGYLFAAGCALSAKREYGGKVDNEDWYPRHYLNTLDVPTIDETSSEYSGYALPYCVVNNIGGSPKISSSIKNSIENGTTFGAWRISKYSNPDIISQMTQKEAKDIQYNSDGDSAYKDVIKAGFIDPYYNDAKDEDETNYKKSILLSVESNADAFLRNVLLYLRKMICDGLLISEVDVMMNDFGDIRKQIVEGKIDPDSASNADTNSTWSFLGTLTDLIKGPSWHTDDSNDDKKNEKPLLESMLDHVGIETGQSLLDKKHENSDYELTDEAESALETLGYDQESLIKLLNAISESATKAFLARLIYPFLMAITENSDEIYNMYKKRDYQALDGMVTYVETGSGLQESKPVVVKFLSALGGINLITTSDEDKAGTIDPSQRLMNSLMKDIFIQASEDPRAYLVHSFYDMLVNDKRGRLVRAFPTYYIVFIDEGRKIGSWKLHDNFYNMNSIASINVVKSRKIASDTCTVVMNNMFNSYTMEPDSTTTQQYMDIYGLRDVFDSIFSPKAYFDKEKAIRLRKTIPDTVVLSPGVRMHVRMGYGADGSKLPIVFNGKIAEVDIEEVAQIVAQGDGNELMNPLTALGDIEALSLDAAQSKITWFKDLRGSLAKGGESPRDLIAKILTAKYGGWKKFVDYFSDGRWFNDNPFGISHFGDPKFAEIFAQGEIVQNLYEVSDSAMIKGTNEFADEAKSKKTTPTINTNIQDKTLWDLLHLSANSGLNYIGAIRDFGFRSTIFLGKPNYYYAYAYELVDGKVVEKRKPFQQFHYIDSYTDIIYNSIKASESQMKTNAVGMWQATDWLWGREQATVGPIYLDMNIYPEYQKSMTVDTGLLGSGNGGIDFNITNHFSEKWSTNANDDKVNKELAWRVTANALRDSVKDMYQGDVGILGNPSIKPHDRVYIHDTYEDMMGMFEVEAVIHNMSAETGFTTSIMPDVIARHDASHEAAVQSLMNVSGATLGLAVGFPIANKLWNVAIHGKLATSIAKSNTMYRQTAKLSKFASNVSEIVGMKDFLDERPTVKSLFKNLNVLPSAESIKLEGYADAINQLSKGKFLKMENYDDYAQALSYFSKLNIDDYQKAIHDAYESNKFGIAKANYDELEIAKVMENTKKAKEDLDKMYDLTKFNAKDFADDILKIKVDNVRLDKLTTVEIQKIIGQWATGKEATIDDIAKVLNNDEILKAIKNKTLKVDTIDDFFKDFSKMLKIEDGASAFTKAAKLLRGGLEGKDILNDLIYAFRGVVKSNFVTLIADLVIEATVTVMINNAKEVFTRFLKGIQAIDVYPLKRWNKPLIAGMNGNKGSVYGYPVTDGYDSMQGMVMDFIEMLKGLDGGTGGNGVADWFVGLFIDDGVYSQLKEKWTNSLNIDYADNDSTNEEHLAQTLYKDISAMYASNNKQANSLMTIPRIKEKQLEDWSILKKYQVLNLTAGSIPTNKQVLDMRYPLSNAVINKAYLDGRFVISHLKNADTSMNIPFETGLQVVPVKISKNIIATPLMREELIVILEHLLQHEKLKGKKSVILKSALNINDSNNWNSTGYKMILDGKVSVIEEVLKEYQSSTSLIKESDGFFKYNATKKGDDDNDDGKIVVIAFPPSGNDPTKDNNKDNKKDNEKKEDK